MEKVPIAREESKEKEAIATGGKKKGKRSFWSAFGTFLMMGGWLLLVIVIMGIVIAVSLLTSR